MNWQAIGVIADIVSAIAVVGSLIYLAIQMHQNTRQSRADNVQATVERWIKAQVSPMRSEESADFLRKALNDYSVLSVPQRARLNAFLIEFTSAFQAMYVKHRSGLLEAELYAAARTAVAGYLKCPGLARLWSEVKFSFLEIYAANWTRRSRLIKAHHSRKRFLTYGRMRERRVTGCV